ncbi:MAG: Fibronectin type III domain protein [Candidatus Levybacteria bacterium GW2011_GWA1_39_32]|nr:MAG: Fibronectin type III domain protein [Candidatus Levybacteria bacterium GW2011_GWA1_39_32]
MNKFQFCKIAFFLFVFLSALTFQFPQKALGAEQECTPGSADCGAGFYCNTAGLCKTCNCGSWSTGTCGGGTCADDRRYQTRDCAHPSCGESRCQSAAASNCTQIEGNSYSSVELKNSNTYINWQVHIQYLKYKSGIGANAKYNSLGSHNPWVPPNGSSFASWQTVPNQKNSSDKLEWRSSCVDPNPDVVVISKTTSKECETDTCDFYTFYELSPVNITCKTNLTSDPIYRGCGGANKDLGNDNDNSIGWSDICPTSVNTSGDCIKGGFLDECSVNSGSCNNSCQRMSCDYSKSVRNWCTLTNDNTCPSCGVSVPNVPTNVTAAASCTNSTSTQVLVNWNAVTGATSYDVRYKRSALDSSAWTNPVNTTNTQRNITGLGFGTSYDFQVRAKNTAGNSSYSNTVSATTQSQSTCAPNPPPNTPNPSATSQCTSSTVSRIDISWSAVSGASDYQVRYRRTNQGTGVGTWTRPSTTTSNSYSITGLPVSTAYYYQVRARNSGGASGWSTRRTITTASGANCAACGTARELRGRVFRDNNGNGVRNAGENYLNGYTIEKWRDPSLADNAVDCQGSTNKESVNTQRINAVGGNGSYRFFNLEQGNNYRVRLVIPQGFECTTGNNCDITNINLNQNRTNNFGIRPATATYTVTGNVFVDDNQDGDKDTGENNYTETSVAVLATSSTGNTYNATVSGGAYTISSLPSGTYGGNSYPGVSLPCNVQADTGDSIATCTGSQGVQDLNFGINNSRSCIQAAGGSIRMDSGYDCELPPDPPGGCDTSSPVISTPTSDAGVVYSGDNPSNFGSSATLNPNILNVDRLSSGEPFAPVIPRTIRTRYGYILANVRQAKLEEKSLTSPVNYCGAGGTTANCNLSSSIPEGVYVVNGPLNITGSGRFTFSDGTASNINNYVILASGEITIGKEIWVGNNSNALFASGADIRVLPNVGESDPESSTANLKGFYSADRNFIIESYKNCPAQDDKRLNIEGSIIANGGLSGGGVILDRSLCANLNKCPALSVKINPRLILSSPGILKVPSYIWKEVAP